MTDTDSRSKKWVWRIGLRMPCRDLIRSRCFRCEIASGQLELLPQRTPQEELRIWPFEEEPREPRNSSALPLPSSVMDADKVAQTSEDGRWSSAIQCFGQETFNKIQNAKVLVIGSGGIGCELLKNLVLSGFKYIEIVRFNLPSSP